MSSSDLPRTADHAITFVVLGIAALVGLAAHSVNAGLLVLFFLIVYLIPSEVAYSRLHHNRLAIMVLNIFLGWSLLGWIIALVWACTSDVEPQYEPAQSYLSAKLGHQNGYFGWLVAALVVATIIGGIVSQQIWNTGHANNFDDVLRSLRAFDPELFRH